MESLLNYVAQEWLTTDEGDPAEDGCRDRSKSSESTSPSGSRGVVQEGECPSLDKHLEMSEDFDSKDNSSSPRGTESSNPFEIEPGHFDFLQVAELYASRQFSSDPGASKGSSTMDDSSSSSRRHSNQSASTSGSVGNPKLSHFMADWIVQPSVGSPEKPCDNLAIEHSSESARIETSNDFTQPYLSRIPQISRVGEQSSKVLHPFLTYYTWNEISAMTGAANNRLLGKGGFGPVYMGILPNKKQVAVKILDDASRQGESEFQNEVILSHLNHKNLVKLVGYCNEGSDRVLVYEHAEGGTLWDHVHGKEGSLDWRTRLRVSLESACALEYLHILCDPRIIHRDIKSSNILLTKQLVAKLADFGLSKIVKVDENENQTNISTVVKGTPGYLDPEYHKTGLLNEKSDIYSFGVVLLEIITGRKAIEKNTKPEEKFIGDWVKAQWKSSGPKGVVDARLGGHYNIKSMREFVTLALKCLETSAKDRPDITLVVKQLRHAIVLEENTPHASKWSLRSLLVHDQ